MFVEFILENINNLLFVVNRDQVSDNLIKTFGEEVIKF
jgi:hypothetical protein